MKIEHAAVWVRDLEAMKRFYCEYFNGAAGPKYRNGLTGFESYFISFDAGARLELMAMPGVVSPGSIEGPAAGYAHLALSAGSRKSVDELTETLRRNGFAVKSGPRVTGDGYYESVVLDPEGNAVEITE